MNHLMAMALFAITMSITPGPVNIITLNAGMRYGFKHTFAYVSGATIGFTCLLAALAFGLSQFMDQYPRLFQLLALAGIGYIAYMAVKMIRIQANINLNAAVNKAPGFMDGACMQFLNPKAWMGCLAGITAFSGDSSHHELIPFVVIYFFICYACIAVWAWAGQKLQQIVKHDQHIVNITRCLGGLLLVTCILIII